MNLDRVFSGLRCSLVNGLAGSLVACIAFGLAPAAQAQFLLHGCKINKVCVGTPCIGQPLDCSIKVSYNDDFGDTTRIVDCFDIIKPGSPTQTRVPAVGNLYIVTVGGNTTAVVGGSLPVLIGPGNVTNSGLPGLPGNGFVVFAAKPADGFPGVDHSYIVQAGDPNPLIDQGTAHYEDLCNVVPANCNPNTNLLQASGSSTILDPGIDLAMSANPPAVCGSDTAVKFTYTVSNTGTVALGQVQVFDKDCEDISFLTGDTNTNGLLDLTEIWTYSCTRNVTANTTAFGFVTADSPSCPADAEASVTVEGGEGAHCRIYPINDSPWCGSTGNQLRGKITGGSPNATFHWTLNAPPDWQITSGVDTLEITYTAGAPAGEVGSGADFTFTITDGGCDSVCTYHVRCVPNSQPPPPVVPPPTAAASGCKPAYWAHPDHFSDWDESCIPTGANATKFKNVAVGDRRFENAFPGKTLLQVLNSTGTGLNSLGRHTVAAFLNASADINFGMTPRKVIRKFNQVYPASNARYRALRDEFAALNRQGCTLNGHLPVTATSNGAPSGNQGDEMQPGESVSPTAMGGLMAINEDFAPEANDSLVIKLHGNTPVIGYEMLAVGEIAELQGTLKVRIDKGFQPRLGDRFQIITAKSVAGEFDILDLPRLPHLMYFDVNYGVDSVTLEVRPYPAPGDLNVDGVVNAIDLMTLFDEWGAADSPADLDGDDIVGFRDMVTLLSWWSND